MQHALPNSAGSGVEATPVSRDTEVPGVALASFSDRKPVGWDAPHAGGRPVSPLDELAPSTAQPGLASANGADSGPDAAALPCQNSNNSDKRPRYRLRPVPGNPDVFTDGSEGRCYMQVDADTVQRYGYLDHASAFFTWLVRQGRSPQHPLKAVFKMETRGNETFKRRALSFEEAARLIVGSGKRGLVYLVAVAIGLRRREMKLLRWSDLHLDEAKPCVQLRAETTKAKRADTVPIIPVLAESLRAAKARAKGPSDLVFPRGVPKPSTLAKDLVACGISVQDARGFRVDFHALRHTYSSLMGSAGVNELARMKLSRHRSWKMTDRYTDVQVLPLHEEIAKFGSALASSIASLKSGKTGQNEATPVQLPVLGLEPESSVFVSGRPDLANAVQDWSRSQSGGEGGIRTPDTLRYTRFPSARIRPLCHLSSDQRSVE